MTNKLQDLLIPMQLPHEEDVVITEYKGFSPEVQAELDAKLAKCARMIIAPAIISPLYPHKAEQRAKLGYTPEL